MADYRATSGQRPDVPVLPSRIARVAQLRVRAGPVPWRRMAVEGKKRCVPTPDLIGWPTASHHSRVCPVHCGPEHRTSRELPASERVRSDRGPLETLDVLVSTTRSRPKAHTADWAHWMAASDRERFLTACCVVSSSQMAVVSSIEWAKGCICATSSATDPSAFSRSSA